MASTSDIKNGLCIEHSNDIYCVVEFLHVKPGKGPAFVRTKLKSMSNGKVVTHTFPSGHKIEEVRVERRKFQFLYPDPDGEDFHFMNEEDYTQMYLNKNFVPNYDLIKEGDIVDILYNNKTGEPLQCEISMYVVLEVVYTEPGLKGDTATNATKVAKLETGAEIRVPLFINEGDKIKIDTRERSYVERAKN
jgi:elongation factor P